MRSQRERNESWHPHSTCDTLAGAGRSGSWSGSWIVNGLSRRTLLSARAKSVLRMRAHTHTHTHIKTYERKWKLCDVCLQQKPGHTAFHRRRLFAMRFCFNFLSIGHRHPENRVASRRTSGRTKWGTHGGHGGHGGQDAGVDNFMHKFIVCVGLYG